MYFQENVFVFFELLLFLFVFRYILYPIYLLFVIDIIDPIHIAIAIRPLLNGYPI